MKKLPIGISNFKELRENDFIFVDKSLLIQEVLETSAKIQLITRPRRFGKTLNLSMLQYFFSDSQHKHLFDGLAISGTPWMERQGCYPVISLSFKDIKERDYNTFLSAFRALLARLFHQHRHLIDDLDDHQRQTFDLILREEGDLVKTRNALMFLAQITAHKAGKPLILLVDEYDSPIHTAFQHGYYEEAVDFIRGMLGAVLKDNEDIHKALLTGIMRVAKESIFSGLNNIAVYTLLAERYSQWFGFTEDEVAQLLAHHNLSDHLPGVRDWYNGYRFGRTLIYNPWSIVNLIEHFGDGFQPYWINTSSNDLVRDLIAGAGPNIQSQFGSLIQGSAVERPVVQHVSLRTLQNSPDALWGFLLFSGYLNATASRRDGHQDLYQLVIPNREVQYLYREIISDISAASPAPLF